jgi:DNA-binding transcriptional ArsR family regulator
MYMARPVNGDDPFRAIAHPVRRKILDMLRRQPKFAGDIAAEFKLSVPAVSQHLAVLRDARLVQARTRGKNLQYRIDRKALRPVERWIDAHRD